MSSPLHRARGCPRLQCMRLENRTALITGAGSGMGREAALLFAREGATVVVVDLDLEAAESTVAAIASARRDGGGAAMRRLEGRPAPRRLRDGRGALRRAARPLQPRRHPRAGRDGRPRGRLGSRRERQPQERLLCDGVRDPAAAEGRRQGIDHLHRVDVGSRGIAALAPLRDDQGGHRAPDEERRAQVRAARESAPTRSARARSRLRCCRSSSVAPPGRRRSTTRSAASSQRPCRWAAPARPSEIAAAALFLASDDSSFITGVALPVDGGYVAR